MERQPESVCGTQAADRREFLRGLATFGIAATFAEASWSQAAVAGRRIDPATKLRGVNLGGWLVLEKWITPTLFSGLKAPDEAGFCEELGADATARLRTHRDKFITEQDFQWIAAHGLNSVRIPVGYWVLDPTAPFVSATETLDRAVKQAGKQGLGVVLDLHAAPGSQNGWDHSGRQGAIEWHTKKENIARTLDVLESIAVRYSGAENLIGIELLNEPRWDVPLQILKDFYTEGYRRVRKHIAPEKAAVVLHDGFRPFDWADFMREPEFANVLLDTHLYQCFVEEDKKRNLPDHIQKAAVQRKQEIETMQKQWRTIVGEWSLGLDPQSLNGLTGPTLDTARQAYADAQRSGYAAAAGWFFWTYKTENAPEWSLRECMKRGWFPAKLTG